MVVPGTKEGGSGYVEEWTDPRYILKGERSGFANSLNMGNEEMSSLHS